MAIQNYVDVCAIVREAPLIRKGELSSRATCPLMTIHGARDNENPTVKSHFLAITEELKSIREMSQWKKLDLVRITGFIATKETDKKVVCPNCGKINHRKDSVATARSGGNIVYVYPIYARKIGSFETKEEAYQFLSDNAEITNRVFLIGNLVREPEHRKSCTRFQLAINRKYCAKGASDIKERTDYPWIYSYGENAKKDFAALRKSSSVFVEGILRSRDYSEDYKCSECGETFSNRGSTLETVSFSSEYLLDCDFEALYDLENSEE